MKQEPKFEGKTATYWVAQLGDHSESFQERAAEVLYTMALDAIPYLIAGLDDNNPTVRRRSRWVLTRLGPPALDQLLAVADDASASARKQDWACEAIDRMHSAALEPLLDHLRHPRAWRRFQAVNALRRLRVHAQPAIPRLIEVLDDPDGDVRSAAVALESLGERIDRGPESDDNLADYERELSAWESLRESADTERMLQALANRMKDENTSIRSTCALVIGRVRWSHPIAEAALQVAQQDPSPDVREAARLAANRLGGRE